METSNGAVKPLEGQLNGTKSGAAVNGNVKSLETDLERRERIISLVIVYFTLFLQSLGLAITMTGSYSAFFFSVFVYEILFCILQEFGLSWTE